MRRLVSEGVKNRFVTGERLEAMLKVRGDAFGFSWLWLTLSRRKPLT